MATFGTSFFHDGFFLKQNHRSTTSLKFDINGSPSSNWIISWPANPPASPSAFSINSAGVVSYQSLGGGGTVNSVGVSAPSIFTVTNSPVTTSGTIDLALASQTANTVLVAPNGTNGVPTFRALLAADIPTLTTAKISDFTTASQALIDATVNGAIVYKGTVNASAGNVTAAGVTITPVSGHRYRVATAGNTAFGFQLNVGDFVTYNGSTWDKTDNTDPSITGATDRITVTPTGDTAYNVNIASTYPGQASIVTLGTIATGVWQGTPIALNKIGTGTATEAATARGNLSAAGVFKGSFTSASLVSNTLTITHGLGNLFPSVTVYDENNDIIFADNVKGTSTTVSTVDLSTYNTPTAIAGTWNYTVIG